MKRNFYLILLFLLAVSTYTKAQTLFSFEAPTVYNTTSKAYELTGVGNFYRGTGGGTATYGSTVCDGIDSSISTSSSTFIFVGSGDISAITIRGTGTGSNRVFSSIATSSTLAGTYTAVTPQSTAGTISGSTCGTIDITLTTAITAGTFIKVVLSGNVNVNSLLLTATVALPPTVTTNSPVATAITSSSATLGGQLTDIGTSAVTVSGVCYSLNANPTIADTKSTDGPTAVGAISSAVSGLLFSTTYHARAYATNGAGTAYGADVTFTTLSPSAATIITTPSSLNFGSVTTSSTSTEKTFIVVAGGLSPASGNISITAPAGYEVSATSGSGFASSINVAYASGGLTSTTIYVHFIPTALVTYNGNITVSGGGATTQNVAVSGAGSNLTYTVGDYGSVVVNGNWGTVATWKQWDGSGFNTVATVVPTTADNVWINNTDTVNVEASGKNCKNLYVLGRLKSSNKVNSPSYVKVYGTEVNVATGALMGNSSQTLGDAADGLSIDFYGTVSNPTNPVLKITGGGTIGISRLRTNTSFTTVTIDNDVTLNYHGSSNSGNAAGYYANAGDTNTLTINAGKTLTFAPWSCYTPVSSSHTNGGAQTININGTITFMPGNPAPDTVTVSRIGWHPSGYMSLGVSGGKPVNVNIGSTGVLNVTELYPNGTKADNSAGTGGLVTINVASGGALNVSKIADFRNATQTVSGAGAFNLLSGARLKIGSVDGITTSGATGNIQTTTRSFSTGAVYAYEGTAAQVSGNGLPATVSGLVINNAAGLTLNTSTTTTDSLALRNGIITTDNTNSLTVGAASQTIGGSTTSHVSGPLTKNTASATAYSFPVGKGGVYQPVTVTPTSNAAGSYTAQYFNTSGASTTDVTSPITSVTTSEYWDVVRTSGPNAQIAFDYDNTIATAWSNSGAPDASQDICVAQLNAAWADASGTIGTSIAGNSLGGTVVSQPTDPTGSFTLGLKLTGTTPVNLLSFNAGLFDGQTKLTWATTNEINIINYTIEKSIDGRNYSVAGFVNAANLTSNVYTFTDINTAVGVSYYRIRVNDKTGKIKYSATMSVNNKKASQLNIFPNPVVGNIYLSHKKAVQGAKVEVYALDGRKMTEYTVSKDAVQSSFSSATLAKGTYRLVFVNGTDIQVTRFIKQ